MKSESIPYNPWRHRVAVFIAILTFVLVGAGALVTSEDAGLSVPDWPTSYGHLLRLPPWVGGIVFEHSHRMIAETVGLFTTMLVLWILLAEGPRSIKTFAAVTLLVVIVQGVLGGITVLNFLPPSVSTAHAALGQTFFCLMVVLAVLSGRKWVEEAPSLVADNGHPKVLVLCLYSIAMLYVQAVLGGMFRHSGMSWWPHVVNAAAVSLILTWTSVRALIAFPRIAAIRRPAALLLFTLMIQLPLGFAAFLTRVAWAGPQANNPMVFSTVAHTSVGVLLLAIASVLTIQVWRHSALTQRHEVPEARAISA